MVWLFSIAGVFCLSAVGACIVYRIGDQQAIRDLRSKMQERRDQAAWRFASKISDGDEFLRAYRADDVATLRKRWPQFWQELHAQDAVISDWRS